MRIVSWSYACSGSGHAGLAGTRYPVRAETRVAEVKRGVREALDPGAVLGNRALLLLSLVRACRLEKTVVPGWKYRSARRRIKELTSTERIGTEVAASVAEIQTVATMSVWASGLVVGPGGGDGGGGGGC
jgi:hypothetical protein